MKFESKYVRCIWSDDLPDSFVGVVADSGNALKAKVEANKQTTVSRRVNEQWPFTAGNSGWHLAYYDPNYECKLAYEMGKKIQVWRDEAKEWLDESAPDWTQETYRIKPDTTRMTYKHLAEWLAKGKGQIKVKGVKTLSTAFAYIEEDDDAKLSDEYSLRRWGSDNWIEPTFSVYYEDCL